MGAFNKLNDRHVLGGDYKAVMKMPPNVFEDDSLVIFGEPKNHFPHPVHHGPHNGTAARMPPLRPNLSRESHPPPRKGSA